jgi:hypothetical protein
MATFINVFIHLFIGATQALSVYGLLKVIESRKEDAKEWESSLRENYQNDLAKSLEGKHHEDVETFSDRYRKDLSSAWKMKKRWGGKAPIAVTIIFAFIQASAFSMFLDMDFGQGWR